MTPRFEGPEITIPGAPAFALLALVGGLHVGGDLFRMWVQIQGISPPAGRIAHELGEPVPLGPAVRSGPLLDAAMSRHGEWVLALGTEIDAFSDGHEKTLPALEWFPAGVGFLHGDPVALVVPPRLVGPGKQDEAPPILLRVGHDSWSAELREPLRDAARLTECEG
jgi:hypothetical protein